MLGKNWFNGIFGKPEWILPDEDELNQYIADLKKEIDMMPNIPEKTKAIYTLANQMQILRMVLHDKKRKLRPDAKGKWVWVEQEKYEGRKYE